MCPAGLGDRHPGPHQAGHLPGPALEQVPARRIPQEEKTAIGRGHCVMEMKQDKMFYRIYVLRFEIHFESCIFEVLPLITHD